MNAEALAHIAAQLAGRVREDDPEANRRWLHATTTAEDREALLYVLAAAVPDDRPFSYLIAWTGGLEPCGTNAAAVRHRRNGEMLDADCREAERKRVNESKRLRAERSQQGIPARETSRETEAAA